jgi:asparagine synthase (glutamine-hydrolysing)
MLSGWGGDELITYHGQSHFSHLLLQGRWLTLHRALRQQARNYRTPLRVAYRNWLIRPMLPDSVMFRLYPDSLAAMWDKKPLPTLFQPDFNAAFQGAELLPSKHVPRSRLGVRRQQLSLLAYGHLNYRIEGWAAAGARMGITYTYPLLDRRIVEFALGLPPDLYVRDGWQRYLFRYALSGVLPDELIWRKDKRDPSLDANRQQIGRRGRDMLPLLLQDILADNRSYQILDGQQAHDIAAAYDGLSEESEAAFDFANVLNSFIVELLVNPELGRAAQERIDAME